MKAKTTFADHAIAFNEHLATLGDGAARLPSGNRMMNPFARGEALPISADFYRKYYADTRPRRLILGINPGRLGAGLTGVPFTDSHRLTDPLGIDPRGITTREPSSVFIYEVARAWGGASAFYGDFYINSPLPLGLVKKNPRGNWVNCNYYETKALTRAVQPLIDEAMSRYMSMPILRDVAWCLGMGKNSEYLQALNAERGYFGEIIALPHPRYVVQYQSRHTARHLREFIEKLSISRP